MPSSTAGRRPLWPWPRRSSASRPTAPGSPFQSGAAQMIDAWFDWIDKAMLLAFPPEGIAAMKVRDRIGARSCSASRRCPLERGAAPWRSRCSPCPGTRSGARLRLAQRRPDLAGRRRHCHRLQPLFEARHPDRRLRLDQPRLPRRRQRGHGRDPRLPRPPDRRRDALRKGQGAVEGRPAVLLMSRFLGRLRYPAV